MRTLDIAPLRRVSHPHSLRRWRWYAHDLYTLALLGIYSALAIIFYVKVEQASFWLLVNVLIAMLIALLVWTDRDSTPRWIRLLHWFYLPPVIYVMYQQVHAYIPVLNPHLYDDLLIAWDYALFGTHPTHWLARFAHPLLTEYLQTTYVLFYFLPIIHATELLRRRRLEEISKLARLMSFGFYASYLAYFALPAIGPRFTLHDFHNLDKELPGLWLTPTWRAHVNAGGGIPEGASRPEAWVHRDCMPSGHTMLTLINIFLAFRFRSCTRWLLLLLGGSLIVATVYLRYHYVVDLIAGALCALIVLWIEPRIYRFLARKGYLSERAYASMES